MDCEREEFLSLVTLLDDDDIVVKECVRKRLSSYGTSVVERLRRMRSDKTVGIDCGIIDSVADSLNADFCLREFRSLILGRREGLPLFEASCIISSLFDREFNRAAYESRYLDASAEYAAEASDQRTAVENIRIFNHIFFHRLRFSVYDVHMKEQKYSVLSRVMKTGEGNPFAIAFIYYMIAQVAGLPLRIVCFPGGFVPVYIENGRELFYINVYRNGEIFLKERLVEFITALGLRTELQSFSIRDEKALMTIYLESLLFVFSSEETDERVRTVESILDLLGPERYLSIDEDSL